MACLAGSVMRVSLCCSRAVKFGIHSAPDFVKTGSRSGAISSTRPRTGSSTISVTNRSTASRGVSAVVSAAIAVLHTSS